MKPVVLSKGGCVYIHLNVKKQDTSFPKNQADRRPDLLHQTLLTLPCHKPFVINFSEVFQLMSKHQQKPHSPVESSPHQAKRRWEMKMITISAPRISSSEPGRTWDLLWAACDTKTALRGPLQAPHNWPFDTWRDSQISRLLKQQEISEKIQWFTVLFLGTSALFKKLQYQPQQN